MDKQREEYYERLKSSKKRLESKENLEIAEKCALNEINRRLTEVDSEKYFEGVAKNNGRASNKSDFDRFIVK
ncbi:MAG: hypothetical protein ACLS28_24100 [Clostridium neonatale]